MTVVTAAEVSAALAATASLGDFFATTLSRTGEWLPFDALLEPRPRIAAVRSVLAEKAQVGESGIEWRVAASTVSLGMLARLIAPAFGALVSTGVIPTVTPQSLWWQSVLGGPFPLSFDPIDGVRGGSAEFAQVVIEGIITPVVEAFRREGVSPVVLVGNVASALGGAARMIGAVRPDLASAAWSLTAELLAIPMLTGTATIGRMGLMRRSCCLFYRVPGSGYCGDCILAERGALSR